MHRTERGSALHTENQPRIPTTENNPPEGYVKSLRPGGPLGRAHLRGGDTKDAAALARLHKRLIDGPVLTCARGGAGGVSE